MSPRSCVGWWVGLGAVAAAWPTAAAELPEGLQAEASAAVTAGRIALALWGAALLLLARRRPRFAVGSFFLLAGLVLGWGALAATGYPLVVAAALLALAAGLGLHAVAPRVAMALAVCWPLPALLAASVLMGGGMGQNRLLLLILLAVGALLGVLLPELSVGLLGAALGTALLALAWPGRLSLWPLLALLVVGIAWQGALPRVLRPPLLERRPSGRRERLAAASVAARSGALVVLAALAVLVLAVPLVAPPGPAAVSPDGSPCSCAAAPVAASWRGCARSRTTGSWRRCGAPPRSPPRRSGRWRR